MSAFFIRRPIVAMVIAIITVLIGAGRAVGPADRAVSADRAAADQPHDAPTPGADAIDVEQSVATPIEQQMNGVDRMLYIQSTNANDGTMNQIVTFDVGTDIDIDNVLVKTASRRRSRRCRRTSRTSASRSRSRSRSR